MLTSTKIVVLWVTMIHPVAHRETIPFGNTCRPRNLVPGGTEFRLLLVATDMMKRREKNVGNIQKCIVYSE